MTPLEAMTPDRLPTPLALVVRRQLVAEQGTADSFLIASYIAETAIKLIGAALYAGLRAGAPDQAYRMAFEVIRADSLGPWESWIRQASSQPSAAFLSPVFQELVTWASKTRTKAEDEWYRQAQANLKEVFGLLAIEWVFPVRKPSVRDLISALAELRNKTKAHGAVGADFFARATTPYTAAIADMVATCPAFSWRWLHLLRRDNNRNRGVLLKSSDPTYMRDGEVADVQVSAAGIYLWPPTALQPAPLLDLVVANRECTEFLLPNGHWANDHSEFIDYASGRTQRIDGQRWLRPPTPLPPSQTQGLTSLDIQSNILGNLPALTPGYVNRPSLEEELHQRLTDRNHPIVTLHGRGGIGKTSLALKVAHDLAAQSHPPFEFILWFSARDIDLRPTGPSAVRPSVVDLAMVAKRYGELLGELLGGDGSVASFAEALQAPPTGDVKGMLVVFDNFETVEQTRELHQFFDTYTHIPNKVLITSRERAFKADYPIEVYGMAREEAFTLMKRLGVDLGIEALMSGQVMQSIYDYSEGHPYVIRVITGEIAKEGRYVPPKTLMARRMDIVDAVFERSFNKLSESGRRVFLTIAGFQSTISELALLVVLSQHDLAVDAGIEECARLSLIERRYFLDNQPAYTAPHIARVFGRKKLEGDPDRLLVLEDIGILQKFWVLPTSEAVSVPQGYAVASFVEWCLARAPAAGEAERTRIAATLEALAQLSADGWLALARFRKAIEADPEGVGYALRRAVEEDPTNKEAWLERAKFARAIGDEATFISSRLRVVEIDPSDRELVREVAWDVCKYVNDHVSDIPLARRSIYLASLRDHMRRLAPGLDATGLSRLAWLYLLEDNKAEAWRYASMGLARDGANRHCRNIVERLRDEGYG